MTTKELAPWIAIAITLALSILVPLFTQIANNRFQLKMKKQTFYQEYQIKKNEQKYNAFDLFIKNVGECIGFAQPGELKNAIASINRLYIYAPKEWWDDIDTLCNQIRAYKWDDATITLRKTSKLIADNLLQEKTDL